jgi:transcriptional regulator with XRE-family HTH domain
VSFGPDSGPVRRFWASSVFHEHPLASAELVEYDQHRKPDSARINQYEKGKHLPHLATAKQLAKVLGVPTPYLYADDDALAAWILAYARVSTATRKSIIKDIG